ncbi:hypothetical protein DPMN_120806 [Dreissena polymorpha]|uniref:Uncharacterized protein n=2 Tax=Dreissena polymorpha TaxID=45954 RepID=A0A9D4GPM1_DREPO|nr:hypothetical protein DPMN_120806 [Dreissena polymorpha]
MINYQSTSANGRNPNANTASPLDINGLGGSLKTKPTQRVTSARDTDRLGSGRVSGVHKDQAPKLDLVMVPNDLNVQRPEEPAARSQTSTTSRQYENHNVDMLPNFRQNSAEKTDILDLTAKDINDFLSLINKLNYNYAAVQRVMDKSKFDACCKFIKTKYS